MKNDFIDWLLKESPILSKMSQTEESPSKYDELFMKDKNKLEYLEHNSETIGEFFYKKHLKEVGEE